MRGLIKKLLSISYSPGPPSQEDYHLGIKLIEKVEPKINVETERFAYLLGLKAELYKLLNKKEKESSCYKKIIEINEALNKEEKNPEIYRKLGMSLLSNPSDAKDAFNKGYKLCLSINKPKKAKELYSLTKIIRARKARKGRKAKSKYRKR